MPVAHGENYKNPPQLWLGYQKTTIFHFFDKKPPVRINNMTNYHQYVVRATLNDLTEIMMCEAHCQTDVARLKPTRTNIRQL
jgi:hypothetical protein